MPLSVLSEVSGIVEQGGESNDGELVACFYFPCAYTLLIGPIKVGERSKGEGETDLIFV